MSGVQRLTEKYSPKAVGLEAPKALCEDTEDIRVSRSRRREKGVPLAKAKADLISKGKLRV